MDKPRPYTFVCPKTSSECLVIIYALLRTPTIYAMYIELSVIDGCLIRGSRVIISTQGQNHVLSQFHDTHSSISRMKGLARSYVWWQGLDKDIENVVKHCNTCQTHLLTYPKLLFTPGNAHHVHGPEFKLTMLVHFLANIFSSLLMPIHAG